MRKPIAGLFAAALSAATLMGAAPVRAEVFYPWCAVFSGRGAGGTSSCGFVSLAQCRENVRGVGGTCVENHAYPGPVPRPKHRRKSHVPS
ncbi:MAG: DUF3551 domain-containing protein [Pseudolabrys sp.]